MLLRHAVALFFATIAFCGCLAAWADEPPELRVHCVPNCVYCKLFAADEQREPLKSALASFRVVHVQGGAARFPTFRIEGNPIREKEGYIGPADFVRWLKEK